MRLVAIVLSFSILLPVAASRAVANEPASKATPTQASSASAPKSTAKSPSANGQELTAEEKDLLSQGYKVRMVKGEKHYCRRETVLGSNLERMVCTTAAQAAQARQDARDLTDQIQRNQANPNGH